MAQGKAAGVLVLTSRQSDLREAEWLAFAQTTGAQIGQAIALNRVVTQLAASERRYRTLMENAHDAISIVTPEGVILEANHRLEDLVGRSREEMIGRNFAQFLPADTAGKTGQRFRRIADD